MNSRRFPLNLPIRLAQKIVKGTLDDPILRQFVPTVAEADEHPGFGCNPVGDVQSRKTSKLLKKYEGRALLICTSACAMHCRYCFRQHFSYDIADKLFKDELDVIRKDSTIHEVILSGGDPLSLSDRVLGELIKELAAFSHIRRIRFHSRFLVGIPERIDEAFLSIFDDIKQSLWFVIHANHPRELDEEVLEACARLRRRGFVMLNQAVLLRGVNDDVETLTALCETLADNGVLPYYLHQLDRAQGTGHFEVSENEGRQLVLGVQERLSGYAVPKYVREITGEPSKTPLSFA